MLLASQSPFASRKLEVSDFRFTQLHLAKSEFGSHRATDRENKRSLAKSNLVGHCQAILVSNMSISCLSKKLTKERHPRNSSGFRKFIYILSQNSLRSSLAQTVATFYMYSSTFFKSSELSGGISFNY